MANKVVFVGMSGGVDSAVSAALLKKEGYEVVGVFIKTWHPDFIACSEEEERRDAMRIAAQLDIPFLTFDLEKVYKKEVADYMIREYRAGRTPNPDVMCNKEVKFGVFLKKARKMGADFVATGHYAQKKVLKNSLALLHPAGGTFRRQNSQELFSLNIGVDPAKDQSYFLWTLNQKQLSKIIFPIGHLKKSEVRKLAKKFRLPVAEKKDSQGICFLGPVDLKEFLKHYIVELPGKIMLAPQEAGNEKGEEIGYHDGVVFHTLGERHGFTITKKTPSDKPYYIVGKDLKKNTLIVSQNKEICNSTILTNYRIESCNWISEIPKENKTYTAQIRYHGEFLPCRVKIFPHNKAEVTLQKLASGLPAKALAAAGQSGVVYEGNVCVGGGVIV